MENIFFPEAIRWLTDLTHPLIETLVSNLTMYWFWCIMNLYLFWWKLSVVAFCGFCQTQHALCSSFTSMNYFPCTHFPNLQGQ